MSSGKRVVFAAGAMVVASGVLVTMVLTVNAPRPVDAHRVYLSPAEPGVLSASHTATVEVLRTTTQVVVIAPPAVRPAPPPLPPPPPFTPPPDEPPPVDDDGPTTTAPSSPSWDDDDCDDNYLTDGICVPLRLPREVQRLCEWLYDQGITRIEVLRRDRHDLDVDDDGIACERRD